MQVKSCRLSVAASHDSGRSRAASCQQMNACGKEEVYLTYCLSAVFRMASRKAKP